MAGGLAPGGVPGQEGALPAGDRLGPDPGHVPEAEPACLLELVCPECGRVTTDEHAPGCEACQTS